MKGQSRLASLVEVVTNNVAGLVIAIGAQALILPRLGIHISPTQHLQVGIAFALVGLARSYLLRRAFNLFTKRASQ